MNISKTTFADTALREILHDNPNIDPSEISLFHQVYYPIANIEVEMDEKQFGDFDTVEKTVLSLIDTGFSSVDILSKLLGVPNMFIDNILRILLGYGHIDKENHITKLGKASLEADRRITEVLVKQIISIDAVSGQPVNIDKSLDKKEMAERSDLDTNKSFLIPGAEQISSQAFLKSLNQDSNIQAMCKKQQLININVTGIRQARLLDIEYASAFAMCIKGNSTPSLYIKMYDPSKEVFHERFSWQPLPDKKAGSQLHPSALSVTLQNMLQDIQKEHGEQNDRWAMQVLWKDLEEDFLLDRNFVSANASRSGYILSAKAFTAINHSTLNVLLSFAKYGVFVYTDNSIHGTVFHLTPDSSIPLSLLKRLDEKVAEEGFLPLLDKLSALQKTHEDIFASIATCLNQA